MKKFFIIFFLILSLSNGILYSPLFTPPAFASPIEFTNPPDFINEYGEKGIGPATHLFENAEDDPTYDVYENHTLTTTQQMINYAQIVRLEDTPIKPHYTSKDGQKHYDFTWENRDLGISINLGIQDVFGNTALKNEVVLATGDQMRSSNLRMISNPTDLNSNHAFNESCYYNNLEPDECAQIQQATKQDGTRNRQATEPPIKQLLSADQWYRYKRKTAEEMLAGYGGDVGNNRGNKYFLRDGVSSEKVALRAIKATPEFCATDDKKCRDINALKTDTGLLPVTLVIKKKDEEESNWFQKLLKKLAGQDIYPIRVTAWIPGARGAETGLSELTKALQAHDIQKLTKLTFGAEYYIPIDWPVGSMTEAYMKKCELQEHILTEKNEDKMQATGAVVSSSPTNPDFPENPITTISHLVEQTQDLNKDAAEKDIELYEQCLIIPQEFTKLNNYYEKIASIFFSEDQKDFEDEYVEIPLVQDSKITQTSDYETTQVKIDCPEGEEDPCYKEGEEEIARISRSQEKSRGYTRDWTGRMGVDLVNINTSTENREYRDTRCLLDEYSARFTDYTQQLSASDQEISLFTSNSSICNTAPPTPTPPANQVGICQQHLFEKSCGGQTCYEATISKARSATCNGKFLNPYYAVAIALNENGGLMTNDPEGRSKTHFGCDVSGAGDVDTTPMAKLECMINTLVNDCNEGKDQDQTLQEYGYPAGYSLAPLSVLGSPSTDLFVSSINTSNLIPNLLGTNWMTYYQGVTSEFCPGTTHIPL